MDAQTSTSEVTASFLRSGDRFYNPVGLMDAWEGQLLQAREVSSYPRGGVMVTKIRAVTVAGWEINLVVAGDQVVQLEADLV